MLVTLNAVYGTNTVTEWWRKSVFINSVHWRNWSLSLSHSSKHPFTVHIRSLLYFLFSYCPLFSVHIYIIIVCIINKQQWQTANSHQASATIQCIHTLNIKFHIDIGFFRRGFFQLGFHLSSHKNTFTNQFNRKLNELCKWMFNVHVYVCGVW